MAITLRSSCTLVDAIILLLTLMASLSESFPRLLLPELNDTKDTRKMLGTPIAQRSWTPTHQTLPARPVQRDANDEKAVDAVARVVHSQASEGK